MEYLIKSNLINYYENFFIIIQFYNNKLTLFQRGFIIIIYIKFIILFAKLIFNNIGSPIYSYYYLNKKQEKWNKKIKGNKIQLKVS